MTTILPYVCEATQTFKLADTQIFDLIVFMPSTFSVKYGSGFSLIITFTE